MKLLKVTAAAVLMSLPMMASAHDYKIADLVVEHPMALETPAAARAGGGYLSVTNIGDTDDRLIEARAAFPRVEFHSSKDADGLVSMVRLDGIDLPAGETVTLKPGGMHVMFMGLEGHPFHVGNEIPVTLVFEKAGKLEVIMTVEAREDHGAKADDHSGHEGHGNHGNHDASN